MCFYDQIIFTCGDWKWGQFRQHCAKEYRTGETCGMKLVNRADNMPSPCKICERINTKLGRRKKEEDKIRRWRKEGGRSASIDKAQAEIDELDREINKLERERRDKQRRL